MGIPVIEYSTILMVGTENISLTDGVLLYDLLTGEYLGQFPNGPLESDPVNFSSPVAFAGGLGEVFVGCAGFTSPDDPLMWKINYFNATNYNHGVLAWLPSAFMTNGLCFGGGFLYLFTDTGTVAVS